MRWSTTLSSKVNLPHEIDFKALFGANLVALRSDFPANETLDVHRVVKWESFDDAKVDEATLEITRNRFSN